MALPCPMCSTPHPLGDDPPDAPVHLECGRCGHRFLPTAGTRRAARAASAWARAFAIRLETSAPDAPPHTR